MNDYSSLAIIIPTINESTLEEVVSAARVQAPEAEIILAGFGNSKFVAEKYSAIYVDLKEKTLKPIALNKAVGLSTKDRFIILDADAVPQKGWAAAMLSAFESGQQYFSGSVDISFGNLWMKVYNLSLLHEFLTGKNSEKRKHIPAISMGLTREFINKIGLFSEDNARSEDYELSLRAFRNGVSPYFHPDAVVLHKPVSKDTFGKVMDYWSRTGKDTLEVRLQYSEELQTPFFMRSRWFILLAAPILALIPTLRIAKTSPREFFSNLHLVPLIYITKIAWCLGAFTHGK